MGDRRYIFVMLTIFLGACSPKAGVGSISSGVSQDSLLISSAKSGNLAGVQSAIDNGAHRDVQDELGNTALHYACENSFEDIVTYLLGLGATKSSDININSRYVRTDPTYKSRELENKDGYTPLMLAYINSTNLSHEAVFTAFLIEDGYTSKEEQLFAAAIEKDIIKLQNALLMNVNRNSKDENRNSYLITLLKGISTSEELLDMSLNKAISIGKNGKSIKNELDINLLNNVEESALAVAIANNYDSAAEKIVEYENSDPYIGKSNGNNALHLSAKMNKLLLVIAITSHSLSNEEKVQEKNSNEETALLLAINNGANSSILSTLTDSGADDSNFVNNNNLLLAIEENDENLALDIFNLNENISPYFLGENGETALIEAIKKGMDTLVTYILNNYASSGYSSGISAVTSNGTTALIEAAKKGKNSYISTILPLVDQGHIDLIFDGGNALMHSLSSANGNDITSQLLVNATSVEDLYATNTDNDTPLILAASKEYSTTVSAILALSNAALDVNKKGKDGNTALMLAVNSGNLSITNSIFVSGLDDSYSYRTIKNTAGKTAIQFANEQSTSVGNNNIFAPFLGLGTDTSNIQITANTMLVTKAGEGELLGVKEALLMKAGIDVQFSEMTALMKAADNGHSTIVDHLLSEGANKDIKSENANNETALIKAIRKGHEAIAVTLVSSNNVNYEFGSNEDTAITYAAKYSLELPTLMETMLGVNSTDIDHINLDSQTALSLAAALGHSQVVEKILAKNPTIDFKDGNDVSVLMHAVNSNNLATVDKILAGNQNGTKPNVEILDGAGKTALMIASEKADVDLEIVKSILDENAAKDTLVEEDTALTLSIKADRLDIARELVSRNADPYKRPNENTTSSTALHLASVGTTADHVALVSEILVKSPIGTHLTKVELTNIDGKEALELALAVNNANILTEFFFYRSEGLDISEGALNSSADTYLLSRSEAVDLLGVKLALNLNGGDIDHVDGSGNTALHKAAGVANSDAVVDYLLSLDTNKTNYLIENNANKTALMIANDNEHSNLFDEFIAVEATSAHEELMNAIKNELDDTTAVIKVKHALIIGADINYIESTETPLIAAVKGNRSSIVTELLTKTPNFDIFDSLDKTALMHAINLGYTTMANDIVNSGADIYVRKDVSSRTALHHAIEKGNTTQLQNLVDNMMSKTTTNGDESKAEYTYLGKTALYMAVELNRVEMSERMADANLNPYIKTAETNTTPLILASFNGYSTLIDKMLANSVLSDQNHTDGIKLSNNVGYTALMEASKIGNGTIVDSLLGKIQTAEKIGYVKATNGVGDTALIIATINNKPTIVTKLLDSGADKNFKGENNKSAINHVNEFSGDSSGLASAFLIKEGYTTAYEKMFEHSLHTVSSNNAVNSLSTSDNLLEFQNAILLGAIDVNTLNLSGETPLIVASKNGTFEVAEYIIDNKSPNLDIVDNSLNTALMHSISNSHLDISSDLVEANADIYLMLDSESNPLATNSLILASGNNSVDHVALVTSMITKTNSNGDQSKINLYNTDGKTALMISSEAGFDTIIKEILLGGINVDVNLKSTDEAENTALIYAATNNKNLAVKELLGASGIDAELINTAGNKALKIASDANYNNVIAEFVNASGHSTANEMLLAKSSLGELLGVTNALLMKADKDTLEAITNETALMKAAKSNTNLDIINYLISIDVNVNKNLESNSKTALMFAIDRKNADGLAIANALVAANASLYVDATSETNKATALTYAAAMGNDTGHVDLINAILATNNVGLDYTDNNTNSALIVAAKAGYDKIVDVLLTAGSNISIIGESSKTALGHAVANVKRDVIKEFLKRESEGYDISTDELLVTALNTELLLKSTSGTSDDLDWLSAINLFVGIVTGFNNLNYVDGSGDTALHKAVIAEKVDVVDRLLALGINYELENNATKTALALVNAMNSSQTKTDLLAKFQDANDQTSPNDELLEGILEEDDALALIKVNHALILGESKDLVDVNSQTMLMLSAIRGHLGITTLLLNNPNSVVGNYNPDLTSGGNKTALHYAIENSKWNVAEYLVDNGATLDIKSNDNTNSIMEAVKHADIESNLTLIDKMLVNLSTNNVEVKINEVDDLGKTAIMHATEQNHPGVVEKLLAFSDTDISLTNNANKTVVETLYELSDDKTTLTQKFLDHKGHATANAMLISLSSGVSEDANGVQDALWLGADIEYVLSNKTALHHASEKGYLLSVQKLKDFDETKFDAIVNLLNGTNETALLLSIKEDKWDVVEYLINLFDNVNINIDIYALGPSNTTALIEASNKNFSSTINSIINLILSKDKSGIALADSNNRTALILMAIKGYNSGITTMLAEAAINTAHQDVQYQSKTALMHAIENDNVAEAILLANGTVTIYATGSDGKTALHFASIKGFNTVVDQILAINNTATNVDIQDTANSKTSLMYASELNKLDVVSSLLIVSGIDTEIIASNNTALMLANTAGHTDIVSAFVTALGSSANPKLLAASLDNSVPKIKNAMLLGADINYQDAGNNNNTPLINAVSVDGDAAVAEILATNEIDILKVDSDGKTAVMHAIGKPSIITLFQDLEVTSADEELLLALDEADDTLANVKIENALALGANVDFRKVTDNNRTALMLASIAGRVTLVDKLISKSANLDLKDGALEDEDTALILSIKNNTSELAEPVVTSLVAANSEANIYARGIANSTALIEASARNYLAIIDIIFAKGTLGKDYADDNGRTALLAAADLLPDGSNLNEGGKDTVVKLIAQSVNLELKNVDGNTALTLVSKKGYLSVATLLIGTVGINLENTGENGKTAIKLASENSRTAIMNAFLLNEGYATITNGGATAKLLVDADLADETASTIGVKNAIWMGAIKNTPNGSGNRALHLATIKEHTTTVDALIAEGVGLDLTNNDSKTALMLSIDSDNANGYTIAANLINNGAGIYILGPNNTTAFIEASDKNDSATIDLILSTDKSGIALVDSNNRTALILMAINGYNSGITAMLAEVAIDTAHQDVKYLDKTALMHAIDNDNVAEAILLANNTVTIYETDTNGETALIMASIKGQDTVVEKILTIDNTAANVDIQDTVNNRTALMYAAVNKYDLVAGHILGVSGIDLQLQDSSSKTAIQIAGETVDNEPVIDQFLSHKGYDTFANGGANTMLVTEAGRLSENLIDVQNALWLNALINSTNGSGETALMLSAKKGYTDSVDLLMLEAGIDLNIEASNETALMLAIANNHIAIASTLVAADAELYVGAGAISTKSTALHYASKATGDQLSLVTEILTKNAVGLDYTDELGNSALILGSQNDNLTIVNKLIADGADRTIIGADNKIALAHAVSNVNLNIIKEFLAVEDGGYDLLTDELLKTALDTKLLLAAAAGTTTDIVWLDAISLFEGIALFTINYQDGTGNTALHKAVDAEKIDAVERLLTIGIDINITNFADQLASDIAEGKASEGELDDKFAGAAVETTASEELLLGLNEADDTLALMKVRNALNIDDPLVGEAVNVNHVDGTGKTMLMLAAIRGHLGITTFLANNGAIQLDTIVDNKTALMHAIENSKWDVANYLVDSALVNPHIRTGTNDSALMQLAKLGNTTDHETLAQKIIASSYTDETTIDLLDVNGKTALMLAAENGNDLVLVKIAEAVTAPDLNILAAKKTAIMLAIENSNWTTADYLVTTAGANPYTVETLNDDTALIQLSKLAETADHIDLASRIVSANVTGIDLLDVDGKTAVMLAAENGNVEVLKKIKEDVVSGPGPDLDVIASKKTALMLAIENSNWDEADYLVDNGANPYAIDVANDDTALIQLAKLAETADTIDVVNRIMDTNNAYDDSADINLVDSNGDAALHIAASVANKTGIVEKILLGGGLNLELVGSSSETAIKKASGVESNGTLLQKFLDHKTYTVENGGANAMLLAFAGGVSEDIVEVQNALWLGATATIDTLEAGTNRTALMLAAIKGYTTTATMLIDNSASKDLMDGASSDENTAIMLAIANSKWDTADYLVTTALANPYTRTGTNDTALMQIARLSEAEDNIDLAERIITANVTGIDYVDGVGDTASHIATVNNNSGIIEKILVGNPDLEIVNTSNSRTVIKEASLVADNAILLQTFLDYKTYTIENGGANAMLLAFAGGISENATEVQNALWLGATVTINTLEAGTNRTAIMLAAIKGYDSTVTILINNTANVNLLDDDNRTALMLAAMNGKDGVVSLIIPESGVDLDIKDTVNGDTALVLAIKGGNVAGYTSSANVLISAGADVNIIDFNTKQALHHASINEVDADLFQSIIDAASAINGKDSSGKTALHYSVETTTSGNLTFVQKILASNSSVINIQDNTSKTPVYYAAVSSDKTAIVTELIRSTHGYDFNGNDTAVASAHINNKLIIANAKLLYLCSQQGITDVTDIQNVIATSGITVDINIVDADNNGNTPLINSVIHYDFTNTNIIVELLTHINGADKNKKNNDGKSALELAYDYSYANVITAFVNDVVSGNNETNYANASTKLQGEVVALGDVVDEVENAIWLGATIDVLDAADSNRTPLMKAAILDKPNRVTVLLNNEADLTIEDDAFEKALGLATGSSIPIIANAHLLHYAAASNTTIEITAAISKGAIVDTTNSQDMTALMIAAQNGNNLVVDELIDNQSASIDLQNNDGKTALMIAAENGYEIIVEKLLTSGADKYILDLFNNTAYDFIYGNSLVQDKFLTNLGYTTGTLVERANDMLFVEIIASGDDTTRVKHAFLLGANVDAVDSGDNNRTALHKAAVNNKKDRVYYLLSYQNANRSIFDDNSKSAYQLAIDTSFTDVEAKFILYANDQLIIAAQTDNTAKINSEIVYGADINYQDFSGYTALHYAAESGYGTDGLPSNNDSVGVLLTSGINKALTNNSGDTAAQLATNNGWTGVADQINSYV